MVLPFIVSEHAAQHIAVLQQPVRGTSANVTIADIRLYETTKAAEKSYFRKGIQTAALTYHFNESGSSVDVMDADGNAQYSKFGTQKGEKNKVTLSSKMQHPVTNRLMNGNLETDGYFSNEVLAAQNGGSFTYDTSQAYEGNRSLKIVSDSDSQTRRISRQSVLLTAGKTYTLSAYAKSSGLTSSIGGGASLFVEYGAEYYENQFALANNWERKTLSFTPKSTGNYWIGVDIVHAAGTVWYDCIQLEEGISSGRFNLVENAGFESGGQLSPDFWYKGGLSGSDGITAEQGVDASRGLKITSSGAVYKNISQDIAVKGSTGDQFVLSGFAKASAVFPELSVGREFHLYMDFLYTDGTSGRGVITFNSATRSW